jgi:hypothetical protein
MWNLNVLPIAMAQEPAGDVTELTGVGLLQRAGQERQLLIPA